jgi:hypothetical protein
VHTEQQLCSAVKHVPKHVPKHLRKLGQEPRARPRGIRSLSELLPGNLSPPEAHAILLSWGAGNKRAQRAKDKRGQQERRPNAVCVVFTQPPSVPHLRVRSHVPHIAVCTNFGAGHHSYLLNRKSRRGYETRRDSS